MQQKNFSANTSGRTMKQWVEGLVVLFIGLTIAHLGVTLFLMSNLGSDPFTILIQGISNLVPLSIGTCHIIALILLMIIMLVTTKGYVKPGTVLCAFCGGWIIDFFLWLFQGNISEQSPILIRIVAMLLGLIILSFGMSLVIKSNSGTGPNDLIAIILTDKLSNRWSKVQFRWVRMSCDLIFTIIGYSLGGVFGIGTIMAVFLIGPTVQFFLPQSEKLIKHLDINAT